MSYATPELKKKPASVTFYVGFSINPATESVMCCASGKSYVEVVEKTAEIAGNLVQKVFNLANADGVRSLHCWMIDNGIDVQAAIGLIIQFCNEAARILKGHKQEASKEK